MSFFDPTQKIGQKGYRPTFVWPESSFGQETG